MTELQLYAHWRSSAVFRIRVALNLKGLTARETYIDIDAGDQFTPAFLAVNPEGAVPALVEPGHAPLTQSMAILEYLEERYPAPPLLPADLHGRARVRSLAALMTSDTHPMIVPRVRHYLMDQADFDMAGWRAWQIHWITRGLQAMEARLARDAGTGSFCHGDTPTLADICLMSVANAVRVFKFEVRDTPTVDRILARCETMEAFARAHPLRQEGAPAS